MKFEEALQAMRNGKRVRQPCRCYYLLDDCKTDPHILDSSGDIAEFKDYDLLADDWEIAE